MRPSSAFTQTSIALLLAVGLAACGKIGHTQPRIIASNDGKSQVMVPAGWAMYENLNEEANIEVANPKNSGFLIVISEPKIDFDEITYHDHSDLTRETLLQNVEKSRVVDGPNELMVQGRKAVQYELQGSVNGIRVVYFHTTVDGEKSFHQILGWTIPSRLTRNRPALDSVIQSFREIDL